MVSSSIATRIPSSTVPTKTKKICVLCNTKNEVKKWYKKDPRSMNFICNRCYSREWWMEHKYEQIRKQMLRYYKKKIQILDQRKQRRLELRKK